MNVLGLRAAPKAVTFAVYDTEACAIINVEDIKIPEAFQLPDALKFVRVNILDVIREYNIEKAGIRIAEAVAQSNNDQRVQVEGVMQESFASSDLQAYYVGRIATIASKLGIDRKLFKTYVDGERDFETVENWASLSAPQREAVLCAIGAERA